MTRPATITTDAASLVEAAFARFSAAPHEDRRRHPAWWSHQAAGCGFDRDHRVLFLRLLDAWEHRYSAAALTAAVAAVLTSERLSGEAFDMFDGWCGLLEAVKERRWES